MSETSKLDFTTFILSIASAAFMGLGMTARPDANGKPGETRVDLELARQNIDLLELLKEKTTSNLTGEEQKLLDGMLYETRMRFVEVQKQGKR